MTRNFAHGESPLCPVIAPAVNAAHYGAMVPPSPLDDSRIAAFAWARYRRIMRVMALVALVITGLALGLLYRANGPVSIHLYIAAALGIWLTIMVAAALMGLMFLSNGTGHDDAVVDPFREDHDQSSG